MIRTTISRIKRVCSVAFLPRIFRGDQRYVACKFEIFSCPTLKKAQKSTKSGNDDEFEHKTEKHKELSEQLSSFSPDSEQQVEKCEAKTQGDGFKGNIVQVVAAETPTKGETHREKAQRIIDKAFGGRDISNDPPQTIDTFQYFTQSQEILEATKREIDNSIEKLQLSNYTTECIEKPIVDARVPFCGKVKDELVEPDDLLINEPIYKITSIAEAKKGQQQTEEPITLEATNISPKLAADELNPTAIKKKEGAELLAEPTLAASPVRSHKEYVIQIAEEEDTGLLKPTATILTSGSKDLTSSPIVEAATADTGATNAAEIAPETISSNMKTIDIRPLEMRKAGPITPDSSVPSPLTPVSDVAGPLTSGYKTAEPITPDMTADLKPAEPITPDMTADLKQADSLPSDMTSDLKTADPITSDMTAKPITRDMTADLKQANLLPPHMTADLKQAHSLPRHMTSDLKPADQISSDIAADLKPAEPITSDMTDDLKPAEPITPEMTADLKPAEPITPDTAADLKQADSLPPYMASDRKPAEPITPDMTADLKPADLKPAEPITPDMTADLKQDDSFPPDTSSDLKPAEPITPDMTTDLKQAEPMRPSKLNIITPDITFMKRGKRGGEREIITAKKVPTPVEDAPLEGAVKVGTVYTADSDRYTLDAIDSLDADDGPSIKTKQKTTAKKEEFDEKGDPNLEPKLFKATGKEEEEDISYSGFASADSTYDPSYIFQNATTAKEKTESLAQKIEKIDETPLVEAAKPNIEGFNITPRTLGQLEEPGLCDKANNEPTKVNIPTSLDEVAKRCLDSPTSQIDEILLKEMEKLGIPITSHKDGHVRSPALEQDLVQMGMLKKPRRRPVENEDLDLDVEPVNFSSTAEKMRPMQMMSKETVLPATPEPIEDFDERHTEKLEIRPNQSLLYDRNTLAYDIEDYDSNDKMSVDKRHSYFFVPRAKTEASVRNPANLKTNKAKELKTTENEEMNLSNDDLELLDPDILTSTDKSMRSPSCCMSHEPKFKSTDQNEGEPKIETESDVLGEPPHISVPKGMFNPFRIDTFREEDTSYNIEIMKPDTSHTISSKDKSSAFKAPTITSKEPPRPFYTINAFEENSSHGEILLDSEQPKSAIKSHQVKHNISEYMAGYFWNPNIHDQLNPQHVLTCNETCPISPNAIVRDDNPPGTKATYGNDTYIQTCTISFRLHPSTTNQPFNMLFSDTISEGAQDYVLPEEDGVSHAGDPYVFQGAQIEGQPIQGLSVTKEDKGQIGYRAPEVKKNTDKSNVLISNVHYDEYEMKDELAEEETEEPPKAKIGYDETVQFTKEASKIELEENIDVAKDEVLTEEERTTLAQVKMGYEDIRELAKVEFLQKEVTDERETTMEYESPEESETIKIAQLSTEEINLNTETELLPPYHEVVMSSVTRSEDWDSEKFELMSAKAQQTFKEIMRSCPTPVTLNETSPETLNAAEEDPGVQPEFPLTEAMDPTEKEVLQAVQQRSTASKHMQAASVLNPMPAEKEDIREDEEGTIPVTYQPLPRLDEKVPLTELLRRVRERSRLLGPQYEVDPVTAKCPRKAPQCAPVAPRSPPSNPVPPPPLGLPPLKRRPPACRPLRKGPKKSKCTACDLNQLNPSINVISENTSQEVALPRPSVDLTEDVIHRLQNLGKVLGHAIRDWKTGILEAGAIRKTDRIPRLKFARDYTPWTPIPSWPHQHKPKPKDPNERQIPERCYPGCRLTQNEIKPIRDQPCPKPCSYPKKAFSILDCFAVSLGDYSVYDLVRNEDSPVLSRSFYRTEWTKPKFDVSKPYSASREKPETVKQVVENQRNEEKTYLPLSITSTPDLPKGNNVSYQKDLAPNIKIKRANSDSATFRSHVANLNLERLLAPTMASVCYVITRQYTENKGHSGTGNKRECWRPKARIPIDNNWIEREYGEDQRKQLEEEARYLLLDLKYPKDYENKKNSTDASLAER